VPFPMIFCDKWLDVLLLSGWFLALAGLCGIAAIGMAGHAAIAGIPGGGQRLAGTSGRDELADAGWQALGRLGHQAAFDGLTGDLGHGPGTVGGVRLTGSGAFGNPGGEVLAAGPLADPGPGVDLGAPQGSPISCEGWAARLPASPSGIRSPRVSRTRRWHARRRRGWIAGPGFAPGR
jgi:hypothetical protein